MEKLEIFIFMFLWFTFFLFSFFLVRSRVLISIEETILLSAPIPTVGFDHGPWQIGTLQQPRHRRGI